MNKKSKRAKGIGKQRVYYECRECKMRYRDKNIAKACEKWCEKYKTCNLELIKYAIKR